MDWNALQGAFHDFGMTLTLYAEWNCSPFRQSKLQTKADKTAAKAQAKQVLLTLKSAK